ncbi:MAG: VCBS repeat-containing protein [Deltaproteobacteria bacterium]|nr:VCBS repeat-containing protein [Deltaproteobacteria bacterium]
MPGAVRQRALFLIALGALCAACGSANDPEPGPFAPSRVLPTGIGARALAALDGPASEVALLFQLDNRVGLIDAADGDLNPVAGEVGVSPLAIAALDTDADGTMELATANAGDSTLSLLGRSEAGLALLASASPSLRPKHVSGADLDGDGRAEVVATVGFDSEPGAGIEVWRRGDAGLELAGPRWPIEGAFAAVTGDVDGDGDLDVIAVIPSASEIAWAANDGRGRLTEAGRIEVCEAPRAAAMAGDRIAVACQGGLGLVRGEAVETIPIDGNLYDVVAGDFDADGSPDVAAVDMTNDAVLVFLAGSGRASPIEVPVGLDPVALVASDLGGDGDVDLIVSAFATRTVDVLENDLANH